MPDFVEGHTVTRFDGELNHLHLLVLEMGGLVLDQCNQALLALENEDMELAEHVMQREHEVDALELKLDSDIWWEVGRRAPVARDLRLVMSFSKAATDLERIGDEAARIAHTSLSLYNNETLRPSQNLMRDVYLMGRTANALLREAIGLLDSLDARAAKALLDRHSDLDAEFQSSLRRVSTFILEDARNVGHAISTVLLIRALERIGAHACNLAEYVIFLVRGDDVRHAGEAPTPGNESDSRPA